MDRRRFLRSGAAVAGGLALGGAAGCSVDGRPEGSLRPPGAHDEEEFLARCIRCGRCGAVCPSRAIRFADTPGPDGGTPYIVPEERACILCMRCTQECPTDALEAISDQRDEISRRVSMGVAEIDEDKCWGRSDICWACWCACPFADEAIRLDEALRTTVVAEKCVGCGICAQVCPPDARAMSVNPDKRRTT